MKKIILFILVFGFLYTHSFSQEKWIVPKEEENKISFFMFNSDMVKDGRQIYENTCQSCHGNPTEADFTLMSPSPGDPASEEFQENPDGSIFYKIKEGRSVMPGFGDLFSDNEIWTIVAYFRSFNSAYTQPKPDLTGIYVPELEVVVDFDYNVDKVIVKVFDKDQPLDSATVAVFIEGYFGNLLLGKKESGVKGILYFDVDTQLPGDVDGNATIIVKISKGYAYKKVVKKFNILTPKVVISAIEGRHLWSTNSMAPIWLIITFLVAVIGVWGVLLYVVLKLRKIKKLA